VAGVRWTAGRHRGRTLGVRERCNIIHRQGTLAANQWKSFWRYQDFSGQARPGSQGTTDPKLLGEAHPSSCTRQVRFFLLAQKLQRSPRECARQRFPSSLAPEQQAAPSVARPWKREEYYSPSWQKGDCMATARYMLVCDTEPLLHTRDGAVTAAGTSNGRRADIGCRSLRQIVRQITRTGVQRKKPFARNLHHKCVPSPQKEANNHHFVVRVTGRRVKKVPFCRTK